MLQDVDINEIELYKIYPEAFKRLLRDHSRFAQFKSSHPEYDKKQLSEHADDPENLIIWATDDYIEKGSGFSFHDPIIIERIINDNCLLIRPRCKKSVEEQTQRVKDKGEVFTPSWVCNKQNNLVDKAWFGQDVFNKEKDDNGIHTWETIPTIVIDFPEGKTWKDYVRDTRLEITCGEAPYLASRYDTTTGRYIPVKDRIGIIDRKLRIISENCQESREWLRMAQIAYQNTYGYEWQGDNLLLARESLLYTFLEYYHDKFQKLPKAKSVDYIAYIISWNIWQMDGLKMVTPCSCQFAKETNIFGEEVPVHCTACEKGDKQGHVGIPCVIKNWAMPNENQTIFFSSLIH